MAVFWLLSVSLVVMLIDIGSGGAWHDHALNWAEFLIQSVWVSWGEPSIRVKAPAGKVGKEDGTVVDFASNVVVTVW